MPVDFLLPLSSWAAWGCLVGCEVCVGEVVQRLFAEFLVPHLARLGEPCSGACLAGLQCPAERAGGSPCSWCWAWQLDSPLPSPLNVLTFPHPSPGYEGHYTNKQGKVREGSATFWRTSRFRRMMTKEVLMRDIFKQV